MQADKANPLVHSSTCQLVNSNNITIKNINTMSQKGKARRERYQEQQAKKGAKVFNWILALLVVGAIIFIAVSALQG